MQRALLIDEIIRHIFHFSAEEGLATLNALARCCRTWEDPALDYLWTRLSSIAPLLKLIPGVELVNRMYVSNTFRFSFLEEMKTLTLFQVFQATDPTPDLTRFHFYASRVKHISHQRKVHVHPLILSILRGRLLPSTHPTVMLPSLRSVKLSTSNCDEIHACLSISGALSKLDIDLGFKTRTSNEHIVQYLQDVVKTASGLQHLSVRGSLTGPLMGLVSSMCNIHTLSLRLGPSLTTDALLAISSFSNLSELEIHVGHIAGDDLSAAFAENNTPLFPSLTQLHIRAHTPLLAIILDKIPIDALNALHIEAEETVGVPVAWGPVLRNISTRASNSLRDLTIEHHIEIDEMELDVSSAYTIGPSLGPVKTNTQIPFSDLQTLGSLRHLSKFVLDTTLPPAISDENLTTLIKGWPKLQYLDIGSASPVSQAKSLTFRSLCTLAIRTPKLISLVVAPELKGCDPTTIPVDTPSQHTLTRLTFACAPPSDSVKLAQYLHRLFPMLIEVDGLPEHEEGWSEVRNVMRLSPELLS
ncbi:hypothetical protein J132_04601 [Termitomyces sp. J132]|nr:hypothetical protein J132_04601 [Termitomyces sp. J132]